MLKRQITACDLPKIYHLLGKRWTLALLHGLEDRPMTFNDLKRHTCRCASPNILSRRLKEMIRFNLVEREEGKRCTYALTTAGYELMTMIPSIATWAAKNGLSIPHQCQRGDYLCKKVLGQ